LKASPIGDIASTTCRLSLAWISNFSRTAAASS
jgi:hypothetical protein